MGKTAYYTKISLPVLAGFVVIAGLLISSFYNYLLFHSLTEIFVITVEVCVFMVAWNAKKIVNNSYFLFIGTSLLFVAGISALHLLSYDGINVFKIDGANMATQLWLVSRYFLGISFLVAPFFFGKKLKENLIFSLFLALTVLSLASIFYWHNFPVAFVTDQGLTLFKKISEYVISGILIASIFVLFRNRNNFDNHVFKLLVASIILNVVAELCFTLYINVKGISNMAGHLFEAAAFYIFYQAVVATGLERPFSVLFRDLKQSEEELKKEITEKEKIEAELIQNKKNQDDFLFQTIHDLRAPSTVIKLILENYYRFSGNKRGREIDEDIVLVERANAQMIDLINDLFSVAAGEKTEISLKKDKVNICDLINQIVEDMRPVFEQKNIKVECNDNSDLALVDSNRTREVFVNLVDNAAKYNRQGGSISVNIQKEGEFLKTIIKDSGIGISQENLSKIFTPYYRGENGVGTYGTGLGLHIAKKLIEKMGGKIDIGSTKDRGTWVSVFLPLASG